MSLARAGESAQTTFASEIGEFAELLTKEAGSKRPDRARKAAKVHARRVGALAAAFRKAPLSDPRLASLQFLGVSREGEKRDQRFPSPRQRNWLASGDVPADADEAFSALVLQGVLGYVDSINAPIRESVERELRAKFDKRERELTEDRDQVVSDLARVQADLAQASETVESYRRHIGPVDEAAPIEETKTKTGATA
jgi:hypothetical protein